MGHRLEDKGCTLICSFENSKRIPTREELTFWLQNQSGLTDRYFEKILQIKYEENVFKLTVLFDSVNCFVAMRQMKNRVLYGRYGKHKIQIECPKGKFVTLVLTPEKTHVFPIKSLLEIMKDYGEIIQITKGLWYESINQNLKIPSGDVCMKFLMKTPKIPSQIQIDGMDTKIHTLSCGLNYDDKVLEELWMNSDLDKQMDYSTKKFDFIDKNISGCKLICELKSGDNFRASQRDVYEWLVRDSGLNREFLEKILVFKKVINARYEILFESDVNCLLAMQEMKQRSVCHSLNVGNRIDIWCPRGRFVDVSLIARRGDVLPKQKVIEYLKAYGMVLNFKRFNQGTIFNSSGTLTFDVRCKMFLREEPPAELQVGSILADIIVIDREPEDHDSKLLDKIWKMIK